MVLGSINLSLDRAHFDIFHDDYGLTRDVDLQELLNTAYVRVIELFQQVVFLFDLRR